jgi:hypothetical protein
MRRDTVWLLVWSLWMTILVSGAIYVVFFA